jgi:hypothetical protein
MARTCSPRCAFAGTSTPRSRPPSRTMSPRSLSRATSPGERFCVSPGRTSTSECRCRRRRASADYTRRQHALAHRTPERVAQPAAARPAEAYSGLGVARRTRPRLRQRVLFACKRAQSRLARARRDGPPALRAQRLHVHDDALRRRTQRLRVQRARRVLAACVARH